MRAIWNGLSQAERTDRHAGAVHDNATGLNAAVSELKQSLIGVVRTSTADVDGIATRDVRSQIHRSSARQTLML